jgi:anti-sigma regulatory factor (Ser/Thr protein kinase)
MEIRVEHDDDRPVVAASGLLDLAAAGRLRIALLKAAAEQPEAVVCDLTDVRAEQLALPVFLTVADEVGAWPSCPVALVVSDPALRGALELLGVERRMVVVRFRADARPALQARPPVARATLRLSPVPAAPAQARSFLRSCLRTWNVDGGSEIDGQGAALVLDELVTNAVRHAATPVDVLVGLRGKALRVAVADRSATELRPRPATDDEESGRGLLLVQALAQRWGVLPRRAGGKVVWALLDHGEAPAASR